MNIVPGNGKAGGLGVPGFPISWHWDKRYQCVWDYDTHTLMADMR